MKSLHLGILSCSFVFLVALDGLAQPFTLPSLTYSYDALEPSIDAMTMEIHLTKHHQAYVNNLNKAVTGTPMEQLSLEVLLIGAGRRGDAVRNNGGGHYNHTLFWEILSPKAAKEPSGALSKAITETFGSLDSLKSSLNKAASTRFGSGWAWLVVTPDKKLVVTSSPNQDNPIMDISPVRGLPILGIDVWEHAYYLKYQNKRGDYLSAIWEVLDWQAVSAKYDAALINPFLKRIELDTWTELTTFHSIISETFHPAEEGNLKPAKERSGELVEKARLLKSSAVPTSFRNNVVRKSLDRLVAEAVNLDKLVKAKKDDKQINKSLYLLHDRFHDIMEECNH